MALLSSYTAKTTPVDADSVPLVDSAASNATKRVTWANIKATLFASPTFTGTAKFGGSTPASASASGTAGSITWDSSYIYVCTATNTWKRVAIATW